MDEGPECLVGWGGLAPWITAAGEVDEDDTEGPEVVGGRVVVLQTVEEAALALGRQVEGRPTVCQRVKPKADNRHSPAKVGGQALGRGEAKVGDAYPGATSSAQDVLGFEVTVEDAHRVAVLDGIDDLQEHGPYQLVVPNVLISAQAHMRQLTVSDSPVGAR